jgi:phage tail sheath protein FI
MSIRRGVVTERSSTSARPIRVSSTLPIALVVTSNIQAGIYCFDSPRDALESTYLAGHTDGNMTKYLKLGDEQFPCIVPTIISVANIVTEEEGVLTTEEAAALTKTNIINATNALKFAAGSVNLASSAESAVGFKPDIVAVCDYAIGDMDVANAIISVCDAIKARTFIDLDADTNGDAIAKRNSFGSDRVTLAKTSLGIWNTDESVTDMYDSGVVLAWLRCYVDGSSQTGYAKSISNRVLPVSSVKSPSQFYPGRLDETDPLTEKQIMSFISYKGIRTWEYATTDADPIWQDARRVRIFDLAAEAVLDGIFWAIDKDLSELKSAKDSLTAFMDSLVGDDVMLGFSVELDEERTTPVRITAGEFYFIIDCQEVPSPRLISVRFNRVDRYAPLVYETLAV